MSHTLPLFLLCLFTCASILPGCGGKETSSRNEYSYDTSDVYTLTLIRDRKVKDLHFLRDEDSPLDPEVKSTFRSLHYFAPDKAFIFSTALESLAKPVEVVMATSKGRPRTMLFIGTLPFHYAGVRHTLWVYVAKDTTRGREWFIPFTDLTTGSESYAAGRFLDMPPAAPGEEVILDFNRAYNPYCAYNHRYDCPIPPAENALSFAVRAGERNFHVTK